MVSSPHIWIVVEIPHYMNIHYFLHPHIIWSFVYTFNTRPPVKNFEQDLPFALGTNEIKNATEFLEIEENDNLWGTEITRQYGYVTILHLFQIVPRGSVRISYNTRQYMAKIVSNSRSTLWLIHRGYI